jgi:hypothetical protein
MTETETEGLPPQEWVTVELNRLFEPFAEATKAVDEGNPEPLADLLRDIGIDDAFAHAEEGPIVDTVAGGVSAADALLEITTALVEHGSVQEAIMAEPTLITDAVQAVKGIVRVVMALDDLNPGPLDVDALGEAMLDTLIVTYLRNYHETVYNLGLVAGLIVEHEDSHDDVRFEKLGDLLSNPNEIPAEVFGWGTEELKTMVILQYLRAFFQSLDVTLPGSDVELTFPAEIESATDLGQGETQQLTVPVLDVSTDSSFATTGFQVIPMPGNGQLPGLAVVPYGEVAGSKQYDLGDGWLFNVEASGEFDNYGLVVRPDADPEARTVGGGGQGPVDLHGEAGISYSGSGGEFPETTLLGDPEASRLSVTQISLGVTADYTGDELVFRVTLPAKGTIGVHPKDFDGFLSKVMPKDGIFYNYDATLGWSSKSGLFFERGGTLEASIPLQRSLGPATLTEVYMAAESPGTTGGEGGAGASGAGGGAGGGGGTGDTTGGGAGAGGGGPEASASGSGSVSVEMTEGTITLVGAASAEVTLGPVTATVKRVGVEADVSFPEAGDGNLGAVDMEMGFHPPSGVGIAIDAGPVSGGGYLEFDPDEERYAGVLQLDIKKLTLNAVGLLTTELPNGEDGFSLLLIITAEFPPVQLGMGFTLNGVGGLLGVNRSVKGKPLGNAVRDGSVGSILFPEDPVANSQRIISDLRSIFPPTDGVHVVGPMAKLGYGGSIITLDVGVILSIPTWKIVLLGKMSTALPDEKSALIELNLAVVGLLDIPNKRVAIDATMYDSRIVMFTVSGDMALRSRWGDDPRFVMSVGGWNPRFDPPSEFPDLDRVRASMEQGNFRMELTGYLAVTSNTFQIGSGVHAVAKVGPLKAEGTLAFDALFQFDPFKFIIDFLAQFSITFKGKGLSVKLDGTLMGPGPFRLRGTVSFELLFISVSKDINVTIGKSKSTEELPPAKVLPKLVGELGKPMNWQAQLPADGPQLVTLRDIEPGDSEVLAHPLGEIGVRQTVTPLDYEIEKFGNATPTGYTKFTISDVTVGGSSALSFDADLREEFAPAKYRKMSDQEKLDSPAFESHPAGRSMSHEGIYCGYGDGEQETNTRGATFAYECTVIDRPRENVATPLGRLGRFRTERLDATSALPERAGVALLNVSASARSRARRAGEARFRLSERELAAFDAQAAGEPFEGNETARTADESATDGGTAQVVRGGTDPDIGGLAGSVSVGDVQYTIATAGDLREVDVPGVEGEMTKSQAQQALAAIRERRPEFARELRVVETHRVRAQSTGEADR